MSKVRLLTRGVHTKAKMNAQTGIWVGQSSMVRMPKTNIDTGR